MIFGEYILRAESIKDDREAQARELTELIRCKDCIKKEICSIFRDAKQEHGFCAWAERKEE